MVEVYSNIRTIKTYCLGAVQMKRFQTIYQKLACRDEKFAGASFAKSRDQNHEGAGIIIVFVFYTGKSFPNWSGL